MRSRYHGALHGGQTIVQHHSSNARSHRPYDTPGLTNDWDRTGARWAIYLAARPADARTRHVLLRSVRRARPRCQRVRSLVTGGTLGGSDRQPARRGVCWAPAVSPVRRGGRSARPTVSAPPAPGAKARAGTEWVSQFMAGEATLDAAKHGETPGDNQNSISTRFHTCSSDR